MKYTLVISLVIIAVVALPNDIYKSEWNRFKKTYNRLYMTQQEEDMRFKIFSKNLEEILHHNELYDKGQVTFKMGVNQFADWTEEEVKSLMGVLKPGHTGFALHLPDDVCKTEWDNFKKTYNKVYETQTEQNKRFVIFCSNLDKTVRHNKLYEEGQLTFQMGVNQFSDLTLDEMKERMGLKSRGINEVLQVSQQLLETEWTNFKMTYNRKYFTKEEENKRFKIFSKKLEEIINHNKLYEKGETTYKMGVNEFSDWTDEEMKRIMGVLPTTPLENSDISACETEWHHFKSTYKKLYSSRKEEAQHLAIFCDNLDKIVQHNHMYNKGQATFKMGVNEFTDLTAEEIKQRTGLLPKNSANISSGFVVDFYRSEWILFKSKYNRQYASEEEVRRFKIFSKRLEQIRQHNELYKKGLTTYKMAVNQFTDMTEEEMKSMMGVLHPKIN